MGEDDFFSDDDLDDIPDNTLQELEQNALSSTQYAKPAVQAPRQIGKPANNVSIPSRPGPVNRTTSWRPPQPRAPLQPRRQPTVQPPNAPPASAPEPPSSDYGFDDEDVVDLDEPSMAVQPASGPQTRPNPQLAPSAAAASLYGSKATLDPETAAAFAAADAELGAQAPGQWAHAPHLQPKADDSIDVSSLHARIAELEADQARLRQAEQQARNAALAKQGEIAIVRANQDKASKEYERRIAVMQKLHADEATRQKAELEAGRKEREKMQTDNRFLQHDLAQEAERAKRLNGPGKARAAVAGREKETPRKTQRTGLGDGFEDEEVQVVSPSKSKEKAKQSTPKHAAKRKRTANDSPVVALSFTQQPELVQQESTEQAQTSFEQPVQEIQAVQVDDRYEFMQRMLSHSPSEGQERSIEALSKYAYPSTPTKSVSSTLMDRLAYKAASSEADHLPLKLSRVLLNLWSRCLAEHYYSPLYLILDLINFALYFELSSTISQLIEEAVPLCFKTVDLIAVPIARAAVNPTFAASLDRAAQDQLADEIGVDEVMDLLLRLAQSASLVSAARLEDFWRQMDLTFLLLMLHKAQPVSQVITTLKILATSTLSTTFGPICGAGDAEKQAQQETGVVDRLTTLLCEMPELPSPDEPAYTEEEIAELRLEILKVLRAMCLTDHGGLLLAQHRTAIGRLIRSLHGQTNKLYTVPPSIGSVNTTVHDRRATPPTAHDLVAQTVNLSVRLTYHLLRTYDSAIDFGQKINVIRGGYHKFLISMTRVAFTEQLVLEQGIEDEVVEAAHTILDNFLSPEEGEAVVRAVETPRGTRGSEGVRGVVGVVGEGEEEGSEDGDGDGDAAMSDPG